MGHVRQQDLLTSTCTSARTSHQAKVRVHLYLDRRSHRTHGRGDRTTSGQAASEAQPAVEACKGAAKATAAVDVQCYVLADYIADSHKVRASEEDQSEAGILAKEYLPFI